MPKSYLSYKIFAVFVVEATENPSKPDLNIKGRLLVHRQKIQRKFWLQVILEAGTQTSYLGLRFPFCFSNPPPQAASPSKE